MYGSVPPSLSRVTLALPISEPGIRKSWLAFAQAGSLPIQSQNDEPSSKPRFHFLFLTALFGTSLVVWMELSCSILIEHMSCSVINSAV
jgi:hypothetical protein